MNLSKNLTLTTAYHQLQNLLTLVDHYDLARSKKQNPLIEERLKILEDCVANYILDLSHPDETPIFPFQNYDVYYYCLRQLHQNPLTHIEIGGQEKVNAGYIEVILRAMQHLQAFTLRT
ncbi:hypothetical protein MUA48_09880 [Staphylococcus sp. IVB6238]|uniref:hypothetical protein n=1 Tax=Staphylococcus sp. IVB6238 TaxID=2989770 RepID=UPI0021D38234|nr:hypothetical protein [Staphylococcus sp. IVB6238]UXR73650.1 hypothetical protein MUA48_09880 [Staphylococcus sp. IVB6238]